MPSFSEKRPPVRLCDPPEEITGGLDILHNEDLEATYAKAGVTFDMAQLWENLPRSHKMTAPRHLVVAAAQVGKVNLPDAAVEVRVIAGNSLAPAARRKRSRRSICWTYV